MSDTHYLEIITDTTAYDELFEKTIGIASGASGFGFGQRDISFYFSSYEDAYRAKEKIDALEMSNVETEVQEL